ncbi:MAG: malectin domain-containing carbohydrate-binding protein, partial [Cyclobacteriaceae bacterium]
NLIKDIPNHNDDGTLNTTVKERQITGILVTGTASNPVVYVSSSDSRIGGGGTGGDKNLDTNSGIISRLNWTGSAWTKTDVVIGLPRSEENHANNGLQLDEANNILYVAVGGHTNAGAPSNNFAFLTEYALAAAIIKVDLTKIDNDFGGTYVLPTLDDPTRANNPDGSDLNDPFGGNDGLNQAKLVIGGPVQIHSPGYRNAYDIVLTKTPGKEGRLYTIDNGANGGWGGHPDQEGAFGDPLTTNVTNNYVVGEPGSTAAGPNDAKVNNLDNLHLVSKPGMMPIYGGHPVPIRANPLGAGLYRFDNSTSTAVFELSPTSDWPPVPPSLANPVEGDFRNPGVNDGALHTWTTSTNGLTEYTSEAYFDGVLSGDLIAASYDGALYRIKFNADGTATQLVEKIASGFGSTPLDVTAQGNGSIFEGTIWAATYGSDAVTVFEPGGSWLPEIASDGSTPVARHENGFIEVGGKFYLIGGRETTVVNVYDPVQKVWSTGGALPISKMHHFQPVVWQDKIYVIGAYTGNFSTGNTGSNPETPIADVYIYDTQSQTWSKGPAIPRPRGSAGLVVYNDEFYLLGGITNGHQNGWVKWMDKFNPTTLTWTELPDLPRERDHFQAGVIDGKIYLAGGRKTNAAGNVFGVTIGEVDVFDLNAQTWSTLPLNASIPTKRAGTMTVVLNNELLVIGGESDTQNAAHNQVQAYSPLTQAWRNVATLSIGRHGTGALVYNNQIYLSSGSTIKGSGGVVNTTEKLSAAAQCSGSPTDFSVDDDGDGFSNGDETSNGTNYCSTASQPEDADGDFISNLNDPDDDNDGQLDTADAFAVDASNGLSKGIPVNYPMLNGDPGTGLFGLGFTGLMTNGQDNYTALYDESDPDLIMGGAVGIANVPAVAGDALTNNQKYGFQFGFKITDPQEIVTIKSLMQGPFFGGATGAQLQNQSQGIFIGKGDQDNYLKIVLSANNGQPGFAVVGENSGTTFVNQTFPVSGILSAGGITLLAQIDPTASTVSFSYLISGQSTPISIGTAVSLPSSFSGVLNGSSALATGLIASSGTANRFSAAWDYIQVTSSKPTVDPNADATYTQFVNSNNNTFQLDLSKIFDGNGVDLSYTVVTVSNNSVVSSNSLNGSLLSVSLNPGVTGSVQFTVRATNPESEFTDFTFTLQIVPKPSLVKLINSGGAVYNNWLADVNFTGGKTFTNPVPIDNTTEDVVYQTERYGLAFSYAIPVTTAGYYQLKLHFAEIYHGLKNNLGVGARVMNVSAEGQPILQNFDIFATAGGKAKAVIMTFDSLQVSDGALNLSFTGVVDQAKISGIELAVYTLTAPPNSAPVLVNPGSVSYFQGAPVQLNLIASDADRQDVLTYSAVGLPASLQLDQNTGLISGTIESGLGPNQVTVSVSDGKGGVDTEAFTLSIVEPINYSLRINAGGASQTFGSTTWRADTYFVGGAILTSSSAIDNTVFDAVYQSDRYGKFYYQIPTPGIGKYKVTLHYAEKFFALPNSRVFDVYVESSTPTRTALDVFSAAGGSFKAYKEDHIALVNDGILNLDFEPTTNNAMVSGIELAACVDPVLQSITASKTEICNGETITLTVVGTRNSAERWSLYSGNCGGTILATNETGIFQVAPTSNTTYFVKAEGLCVENATCAQVQIIVNPLPQVTSFTSSQNDFCVGNSTTLTVTGTLGTATGWHLYSGSCGGTLIASNTTGVFQVTPTATTVYYLRPEGGCSKPDQCFQTEVRVKQLPSISAISASTLEICQGQSSTISITGSLGAASGWNLYSGSCGGTPIASNATGVFVVNPLQTTTYFVGPVGDCSGTVSCKSIEIKVLNLPNLQQVTASSTSICSGTSTVITVTGTLGAATSWGLFSGDCSGTPLASNSTGVFTVSPTTTTKYFVKPIGSCAQTIPCKEISIQVLTTPTLTSISASSSTICAGNSTTLTVTGSLGAASGWQLFKGSCDGTPVASNATGIFQVSPTENTTYFVKPTGTCSENVVQCKSVQVTVLTVPVLENLTASDTDICLGEIVTLTVSGSLGSASGWSLFAGSCSGTPVATNSNGVFTVSPSVTTIYYVKPIGSCSDQVICKAVQVTLSSPPVLNGISSSVATICSGQSATLTVNGSLGAASSWELYSGSCSGQPIASGRTGSFSVSPTQTTTYFVKPVGSCSSTIECKSVTVTVNASPVITTVVASKDKICVGESSTITVTGSLGSASSWALFATNCSGTALASNAQGVFTVSPTQTTKYFIKPIGTCSDQIACQSVEIAVSAAPSLTSVTSNRTEVCKGESVTLTITGSLGAASGWELYSGSCSGQPIASGTTNSFNVSPTQTTTYFVKPVGSCSSTIECKSVTVTVNASPVITTVVASKDKICVGESSTITVTGSLGSASSWALFATNCSGTALASNAQGVFSVSPTQTTTYFIKAVGTCSDQIACRSVEIVVSAVPSLTSVTSDKTEVCKGGSVTLTTSGTLGAATSWGLFKDSCSGTPLASNASGVFVLTPEITTTYFVKPIGSCADNVQCKSVKVTVLDNPVFTSVSSDVSQICSGGSATLRVTGSLGSATSWAL